jgi:hypothetical protein
MIIIYEEIKGAPFPSALAAKVMEDTDVVNHRYGAGEIYIHPLHVL